MIDVLILGVWVYFGLCARERFHPMSFTSDKPGVAGDIDVIWQEIWAVLKGPVTYYSAYRAEKAERKASVRAAATDKHPKF